MLIIKFFCALKYECQNNGIYGLVIVGHKVVDKLISFIPQKIQFVVLKNFYNDFYKNLLCKSWINEFKKQRELGIEQIPVFIVSYNRLSYLKCLIVRLEKLGIKNIHIIDNVSTYPPLLEYYSHLSYQIHYMKKNYGHMVFWKCDEFERYRKNFYVVTDPDVLPVVECPDNFMQKFFDTLEQFPFLAKVGFSLKIDDLPVNGVFGDKVVKWEEQFWKIKIPQVGGCYAAIDTTFALYPPQTIATRNFSRGIRMDHPFQARHLPWYKVEGDIMDEDKFYSQNKTNGWWDVARGEMTPDDTQKINNKNTGGGVAKPCNSVIICNIALCNSYHKTSCHAPERRCAA